MKYTPGEWRIVEDDVFAGALGMAIHSEDGEVIASMVKPNNAPLIAAAPKLADIARQSLNFLNAMITGTGAWAGQKNRFVPSGAGPLADYITKALDKLKEK